MKKIIFIALAIIIVAGIIITATIGLNVDIMYKAHEQINIYIGKETNINEIQEIAKEVFGNQKTKVIVVEAFNDAFAINTESVSDEQIESLKQKVGEKYSIEDTSNTVTKSSIPKLRLRDIIKPYIMPVIIATAIIFAFMAVRYKNMGITKVIIQLLQSGIMLILAEALLLSIIAITRYPVNQYIILGALAIYFTTLMFLNAQNLKELEHLKEINEKD